MRVFSKKPIKDVVVDVKVTSRNFIMGKQRDQYGKKIKGQRGVPLVVTAGIKEYASGRKLRFKDYMKVDTTRNKVGGQPQF